MQTNVTGDTESLKFRIAETADLSRLTRLVQSSYRGNESRVGWTHEDDLFDGQRIDDEEMRQVFETPKTQFLIAENRSGTVACCQLVECSNGSVYFGLFAVDPTLQGRGVGRQVMQEAERIAMAEGASKMRMSVLRQRTELIAWYERLGYAKNGETEPFPYGEVRFGVPKRDDLEFVVLVKPLQP